MPVLRFAAEIVAAILVLASVADAQDRTLYWKSLSVRARLEGNGGLRVSEEHHIVFDGVWNGAERPFRAGAGRPEIISLARIDPMTKKSFPLSPATAPAMGVDEYAWAGANLRWRTRRATDPPFRNQAVIYVVEYRLHDVLFPDGDGDGYRIDHDFAFTGRPGVIQHFSLALEFDRGWVPAPGVVFPLERLNLGPEQTVTVVIPLKWMGMTRPSYVAKPQAVPVAALRTMPAPAPPPRPPASRADKGAAFALFVVLAGLATFWFVRREEACGAYGRSPDVTPDWLEENIFRHRAEVIGAAWDGETGQAEAAALISILITEGKIANMPRAPPRLSLLVPRDTLVEYERWFVERLFVEGDEIDPDTLRRHYAASGFDPAAAIRGSLKTAAQELVGSSAAGLRWDAIAAAGIVILILPLAGLFLMDTDPLLPFMAGGVFFTIGIGLASLYRAQLKSKALGALIALPLLVMAAVLTSHLTDVTAIEVFLALTLALLGLAFRTARSTGSPRDQENLRALRAARRFFKGHLRRRQAKVEERWIPYLLAFGLGKDLDRWSVTAVRRESPPHDPDWQNRAADTDPGSSSSADPSFRPGGGAFGGAGASGSWASSIGSFAAVVAAPAPVNTSSGSSGSSDWSSSSSDSSSGSGSGGGSGGGW